MKNTEHNFPIFAAGIAVGAVVAMAILVVAIDLSEIPKFWAYILVALLCTVAIFNGYLIFKRGHLVKKVLGIGPTDISSLIDRSAIDTDKEDYKNILTKRVPEAFALLAEFRFRTWGIAILLALLAELVLVMQIAALVKQTDAIELQTKRLIERDIRDLFWDLHNHAEHDSKVLALKDLISRGLYRFDNLSLPGSDLSRTSFHSLYLSSGNLSDSNFTGIKIENAGIERSNLRNTTWDDADVQGVFDRSNFEGSSFKNTNLKGRFGWAIFKNANFTGANIAGASFENANFENTNITAQQLASAHSISNVSGLKASTLKEVKKLNPGTMRWWKE